MFKGKIYVKKVGKDGKVQEFEKEFDNPHEFMRVQNAYQQPEFEEPVLGLNGRASLQNYFNNLIDERFGLVNPGYGYEEEENEKNYLPEGIDMDAYEEEAAKIEYEKSHKTEKINKLKESIETLKGYKVTFEKAKKNEMVKKVEKDIKAIEAELNALQAD